MKKLDRSSPELDFVKMFAGDTQRRGILAYSDEIISNFGGTVAAEIASSLARPHRVRGIQAEYVFQTVAAGLGALKLIKAEDAGDVFYEGADVAVPDYRLVLRDGSQRLVEVKAHAFDGDPKSEFRISDSRMRRLRNYADLMGLQLLFAIYWEDVRSWTLNSIEAFAKGLPGVSKWSIGYGRAFGTSLMCETLGDAMIGTPFPLRYRIYFDVNASEPVKPFGEHSLVVIDRIELLSQDRPLTGLAAKIAGNLYVYGNWEEQDQESLVENDKLRYVDYPIAPSDQEDHTPDSCVPIAVLSGLITRAYLDTASDAVLPASEADALKPGFMGNEFIPDDWVDRNLAIPIAKFHFQPNYEMPFKIKKHIG